MQNQHTKEIDRLIGLISDPSDRKTAENLLHGLIGDLTLIGTIAETKLLVTKLTTPSSHQNDLKKTMGDDNWLTTEQTCRTLGIGRTHLHKLKAAGLFPNVTAKGKNHLFSRQDIEHVRTMDKQSITKALRQGKRSKP